MEIDFDIKNREFLEHVKKVKTLFIEDYKTIESLLEELSKYPKNSSLYSYNNHIIIQYEGKETDDEKWDHDQTLQIHRNILKRKKRKHDLETIIQYAKGDL